MGAFTSAALVRLNNHSILAREPSDQYVTRAVSSEDLCADTDTQPFYSRETTNLTKAQKSWMTQPFLSDPFFPQGMLIIFSHCFALCPQVTSSQRT